MPRPAPPDLSTVAATPLESLDDQRLREWKSAAIFRKDDVKLSWFTRYRWRRQFGRLMAEWMRRTAEQIPQGPDMCQRCGTRPTTHDIIYGHGVEQHFAYFCDDCAKREPPGRFIRGHRRRT